MGCMMDNPGVYSLSATLTITTAQTLLGDAIIDLDGMQFALLQLRLAYGSGGTTIRAYRAVLRRSVDDLVRRRLRAYSAPPLRSRCSTCPR
jgi:hypothetical protein